MSRYPIATISVLILSLALSATLLAQVVLVPVGVATSMTGIYLSVVSPATCSDSSTTVSDGTYVKSGTKIHIDTEATAVGVCQFWYQDTHYPEYDYNLAVLKIAGTYTYPNLAQAPLYYFESYPYVFQDYDTRSPNGGSGYIEVIPSVNDVYNVDLQAYAAKDVCTNTSPSPFMNESFNIVSCVPNFRIDTNANIVKAPIDGSPIKISVPVRGGLLEDAVDSAISNWTSLLAGYGQTVSFTKQSVLCTPTDTHCVTIKVQNPPTIPNACGETQSHGAPSDGTWDVSSTMYILPAYTVWTDSPSDLPPVIRHAVE